MLSGFELYPRWVPLLCQSFSAGASESDDPGESEKGNRNGEVKRGGQESRA